MLVVVASITFMIKESHRGLKYVMEIVDTLMLQLSLSAVEFQVSLLPVALHIRGPGNSLKQAYAWPSDF